MAAFFFKLNMKTIAHITLWMASLCAVAADAPVLTPKQEQAMQKDVETIKKQAQLMRSIRDAASAEAAFEELCRLRSRQMMQKRHLQNIRFESSAQFRAVQAHYGWSEQDSMENKYQTERLASQQFYGVEKLALLFGLSSQYAHPVATTPPADDKEALCQLLRSINSQATADAAAPRVAELLQKSGMAPALIMGYHPEADHETRMLHAEYISLHAVNFYGSAPLRAVFVPE